MSEHCTVEKREAAERAARTLRRRPQVQAVDVLPPARDPTDRWTLDIVLAPEAGGLPPAVETDLAAEGFTTRRVTPQGPYWGAVAVFGGGRA
ncbi:hypothetical protein SAMN05216388_1017119 [Halorientalis persicus]|uniref:Uncharacterized protein n=1 Tax=Halorientalis persicus TaxID=1367881 RepID=A0A1H8S223_9EURY|nr:hypothetical protein [Halorientalis persicus]SEO72721.1 hypothetical protein SAMN05216388_1017119 [Halorientalis persicus]